MLIQVYTLKHWRIRVLFFGILEIRLTFWGYQNLDDSPELSDFYDFTAFIIFSTTSFTLKFVVSIIKSYSFLS